MEQPLGSHKSAKNIKMSMPSIIRYQLTSASATVGIGWEFGVSHMRDFSSYNIYDQFE